jgi:hypothetical protein
VCTCTDTPGSFRPPERQSFRLHVSVARGWPRTITNVPENCPTAYVGDVGRGTVLERVRLRLYVNVSIE